MLLSIDTELRGVEVILRSDDERSQNEMSKSDSSDGVAGEGASTNPSSEKLDIVKERGVSAVGELSRRVKSGAAVSNACISNCAASAATEGWRGAKSKRESRHGSGCVDRAADDELTGASLGEELREVKGETPEEQ